MGNCSRKMKRRINTWYYTNKNGIVSIGTDMFCPNCNRHFGPSTTYNTLNYHLDNCLETQPGSTNSGTVPVIGGLNIGHTNYIVGGTNASSPNEKYIWIKKTGPDNVVIWEKTVSTSSKHEGHLINMSLESAKQLNFVDKEKWFKIQTDKFRIPWTYGADYLEISEYKLLETTLKNIKKVNLHKEVKIVFEEEKKVNDAGGLLREFIHLICKDIFKAEKELFMRAETQDMIYKINPKSEDTQENLDLYKLIGKIIGKAIFEQMTIPVQLDRLLLKQIIQKDFCIEDLVTLDKSLYNSLKYIKENTIGDSEVFEESFIIRSPVDSTEIDLVTNGSEVKITDDNKDEFIQFQLEWLGKKFIQKKIDYFLQGLNQVIPAELFQVFTIEELEMLLNGLPFIDTNDWEANTVYKGVYNRGHQVVKWFWEVVKTLDQEQLSKLFHFCTASTHAPVEGFRALQSNRGEYAKFTVESVKYNKDSPGLSAHTCFNRLELPVYPKKEILEAHIRGILGADFEGVFGIE